jgi:ACS family hexuronate transporter-like MFS transporter
MKQAIGKYRWVICTLLLLSTTINYMDRQVIGYLQPIFSKPKSEGGLGWSPVDFGNIISFFTLFYAGVTALAGWVIDKIGTKLGLALSLIIWSFFGALNAFCGSAVINHAIVRSLFGIGEAGNFPASIKTVAEWFPKKERSLATGIFNSGANIGAMIASLTVPVIAYGVWFNGKVQGWQMAYIITGAVGLVWLILWFWLYNPPSKNKRISKAEYEYIHQDDVTQPGASVQEDKAAKVPWGRLLFFRQTWAFFIGKFMTDGIWWFLLFWLPTYMKNQFHMEGHAIMLPLFVVYGVAIIGSTAGGGFPMVFINRGIETYRARMTAMFIIALFPLLLTTTQHFGNTDTYGANAYIYAMIVICIGAGAHQAWSANLFTTVSDMFPKKTVASVTGIGGLAGGLGGVLVQQLAGHLSKHYQDLGHVETAYAWMFGVCAFAYVTAWIIMYILVPRMKPVII